MSKDQSDRQRFLELMQTGSVGDRYFIDAILEDLDIEPNFYDGMKAQEVIDASLES